MVERASRGVMLAVMAVVALAPPAVQHAEVDRAVEAGLLPRGAARLQRVLGRIQPPRPRRSPEAGPGPCRSPQRMILPMKSGCMEIVNLADQALSGSSWGWALPAKMITTGRSGSLSRTPAGPVGQTA